MNDLALKTLEPRELRLNTISLRGFYGKKLRKGSGGGSSDGFPALPGDVTRWHFGGLTNEMMAAMDDPRLEDADHKGRFLSFKNFAWKEGSGISNIYPGALVFDGVDDYGVCENFPILTKEKGYTVVALRQWLSFQDDGYFSLVANSKERGGSFNFEDFRNARKTTWSWGTTNVINFNTRMPYTYQTSTLYSGKAISAGTTEKGGNVLQVCRSGIYCANAAIWEIVILDHDATEEELTKIKDYFVKTYPWLFPDQAWTVTGKTNEDADRDTIANITGNGNDLILQNFGFAEESGYGLYETNFMNWVDSHRATFTRTPSKINVTAVLKEANATFTYSTESRLKQRIKVTGLPEGVSLILGRTNFVFYTIAQDGIYDIDVTDDSGSSSPIIGYRINKILDSCDITIEQISEYEGYLVTDGVDDRVTSDTFTLNKDWTIVGNWKMLQPEANNSSGIVKQSSLFIYNHVDGLNISINNAYGFLKIKDIRSVNAVCSDGRIYLNDWTEIIDSKPQNVNESVGALVIGILGSVYTKLAFKNLGIYNNQILSKENCIKAYSYLQTLKAK